MGILQFVAATIFPMPSRIGSCATSLRSAMWSCTSSPSAVRRLRTIRSRLIDHQLAQDLLNDSPGGLGQRLGQPPEVERFRQQYGQRGIQCLADLGAVAIARGEDEANAGAAGLVAQGLSQ